MIIGLELLYSWLASSNHCSSPLVLTGLIVESSGILEMVGMLNFVVIGGWMTKR